MRFPSNSFSRRVKNKTLLAFGVVLSFSTAACAFRLERLEEGATSSEDGALLPADGNAVGYDTIKSRILQPNCLSCHGGREQPVLLTYDQVKANLNDIVHEVITEKSMPKRGPLSEEDQALLQSWVDAGAPEQVATPTVAPSPTPIASNRPVTYAMLRKSVLDPACISCHYAGNTDEITPLDDYETTKEMKGTLWALVILKKTMPPTDEPGIEPLTDEQKQMVSDWFVDGMQE